MFTENSLKDVTKGRNDHGKNRTALGEGRSKHRKRQEKRYMAFTQRAGAQQGFCGRGTTARCGDTQPAWRGKAGDHGIYRITC